MESLAASVGMFDGVHLGHQALVRCLCSHAQASGFVAAVFTFDMHPLQLVAPERAPKLLTPVSQRIKLLQEAGAQEVRVLQFDKNLRMLSACEFMRMLRDDYNVKELVMGFNHRFGHDRLDDFGKYKEIGRQLGIETHLCREAVEISLPAHAPMAVSSSAIRHALLAGNVETANAMLGREYGFSGSVAHGSHIGHTIGFPTANIVPEYDRQLVPANGVYACRATLPGSQQLVAMTNIGLRPTLTGGIATPTIEAHIVDFDGDLYGQTIELSFVARLRSERRFSSLDELRAQLLRDKDLACEIVG